MMSRPEKGFGVYFYPPIEYEEEEAIFKFCRYKIYINKNGYLATYIKNKVTSEEIFNSIFLSTSLLKYQVLRAYEGEFETLNIVASGAYYTPRVYLGDNDIGPIIRSKIFIRKILIKKSEFEIIIKLAEEFFKSKYKYGILAFFESYTRNQVDDYIGNFLIGWFTIDYYVSIKIESFYRNRGKTQRWIDNTNRNWGMKKKLRKLKNNRQISIRDYERYEKLRIIRNGIVHSQKRVTGYQSRRCMKAANAIMWKLFKMDQIKYKRYLESIQNLP